MAPLFQRISALILKSLRDELSPEEQVELQAWLESSAENRKLYSELTDEDSLRRTLQEFYESDENVWRKIEEDIEEAPPAPVRRMRPWRYVAAASVTIFLAAGAFWWLNDNPKDLIGKTSPAPMAVKLEDIVADTVSTSTLTLADGTVVNLDEVANGIIAQQNGSPIIKNDSAVEYSFAATDNKKPAYNTVNTGRGDQLQLRLPDGSRVWLNAQSSITYPTFFTGDMRSVQLTGEAYFEIKSIATETGKMPFVVQINSKNKALKGEVEVLGTRFNVNAYDDEVLVKTTLVEGKVRMRNNITSSAQSVILRPGEQARLAKAGKIAVVKDEYALDMAIAWTKNEFTFRGSTAADIFREACRWYPITVSYPDGEPTETFGGSFDRGVSLAHLLKIFSESGMNFKLEEGNKLIVRP